MRGSVQERIYLVDQWVTLIFGDKKGDETGGDYSQLFTLGWDSHDECYTLITPHAVYVGQIGEAAPGFNYVTWDLVTVITRPILGDDTTLDMALPEKY